MDFAAVLGDPHFDSKLRDFKRIRRCLYRTFSLSQDVPALTAKLIKHVKDHCTHNSIGFKDSNFTVDDFLNNLTVSKALCPDYVRENIRVPKLVVTDIPLSPPIRIGEDFLIRSRRDYPTSNQKQLGTQHIFFNGMYELDDSDSETSSSNDSETEFAPPPSPKRAKTSPAPKQLDCDQEIGRHLMNYTKLCENTTKVDVLLYVYPKEAGSDLAKHFGLIHLDKLMVAANRPMEMDEVKLADPNSKSYRILHSYLTRELMFGASNVCITSNAIVFRNVQANVKASFTNDKDRQFLCLSGLASFSVELGDHYNFFEYASALAVLINTVLGVDTTFQVYYSDDANKKNYCLTSSLVAIIPLYVLRFMSAVKIKQCNLEPFLKLDF